MYILKNTYRSKINNLTLHLKFLGKQEQAKYKTSQRRDIIKLRAGMNEIETPPKNQK
jgi:hypothetical protein